VLVTVWNEESVRDSLDFAAGLRRDAPGLRVDVYPEADKLGKQLKYASARGVPFVVVIGDDERARGEVTIKNMSSGEQQTVERGFGASTLREGVRLRAGRSLSAPAEAGSEKEEATRDGG
jgi:histidyl-tRNA synthetase